MAQRFEKESADDFLENVDNITKRVQDILDGKTDVIEEEERFWEEQKLKEVKKTIREREAQEELAKGISGRGYKGNFKTYCKGCQTEYHHEAIENCNKCGRETISHEVSQNKFLGAA